MLLSKKFIATYGSEFDALAQRLKLEPEIVHLPDDPQARLTAAECARIVITMQTRDIRFSPHYKTFGDTLVAAHNLKWAHFHSTAIDQHPFVRPLLERGVTLTTSAGSNGEPVAQTAIAGLLLLARGFPRWLAAQHRRAWEPVRGAELPRDLRGQTILIVGLGTIGMPIARFCRALGMYVIGIRRSPARTGDAPDEIHPPSRFVDLLPRAQWLVLACPHTADTHHLLNAQALARLPRGAALINVSRGGVADEAALIDALGSGQLGCAHLDVFAQEPLPADSPLWNLPNVMVTPHNASASSGNDRRAVEMFFANLEKWARGEPLPNQHRA
jgi:phosphoglycerate dehydrogenase-like enzyme